MIGLIRKTKENNSASFSGFLCFLSLCQIGVDVECSDTGCPPVRVRASGIKGRTARVSGKISSQYLSALLMAAPLSCGEDVAIEIVDELVSAPYVHMTIKLMDKFG